MSIRLELEPRDLRVGVCWKRSRYGMADYLDVWIGFLPMLSIHFRKERWIH